MLNSSDVKAVFFDLDGTLTSYQASAQYAIDYVHGSTRSRLQGINRDMFSRVYWEIFDRIEQEQTQGKRQPARIDRTLRFSELLRKLNLDPSQELAVLMADLYSEGRARGVRVFEDLKETLTSLQTRFSLGVITEGSSKYQRTLLHNAGLTGFFLFIIISEEIGYHKPDPRLFLKACEMAETLPGQSVMVGDRFDWDMVPAKKAGMQTVLFTQDARYADQQTIDPAIVDDIARNYRDVQSLFGIDQP